MDLLILLMGGLRRRKLKQGIERLAMRRTYKEMTLVSILMAGFIYSPAIAQTPPQLRNRNIAIEYYEPRNRAFQSVYERWQKLQVLEKLSAFLAPVKWTKKLRLMTKECSASDGLRPEVYYNKNEYSLAICYQWLAKLRTFSPPAAFASKQQVITGALVGIVLDESARAMFDMLNVPVLGSEEDAADQVSAYVALKFGDTVAATVIKGTYYAWKAYDPEEITAQGVQRYNYAARASSPRQRRFNILCIAYAGAPGVFKNFVDQGDLLSSRAENCAGEYRQVEQAFQKLILPRIDENLMKLDLSVTWLSEEDLN
jgi:hypothetical protein